MLAIPVQSNPIEKANACWEASDVFDRAKIIHLKVN
jgi:hypothetical protein